jgi:hypothetical protein
LFLDACRADLYGTNATDFADCLTSMQTAETLSFDRSMAALPGVEVLE